ncbi:hypothetical protein [Paracoccus sp. (in: a-proteobacteria)]|uniref:hypothetical protein n=1 Tax=Paracoccus sp. TaxID=267 RepID=UPI0026DFD8B2|nr:hypothetical protein [Paracoccus sp. (in: a-proteobacteria)]MDO5648841.1 hypothetical protein [Paracoccus sp. (in: a-proteobacteria)]
MTTPMDTARAAWGEALPDWVAELAQECSATSQNKVAARLDRSAALVSQVLRNKYAGDLDAVQARFNGVFRAQTTDCPELGLILTQQCQDWQQQARRFVNVNAMRVRMFRACNACPHFKGAKK